MPPWNAWYHVTAHTYGSWYRGDPRGWRSRHHREHVDGDYKNPPAAGKYDKLLAHSKSLMKRDPVQIDASLRKFILDVIVERLQLISIQIAVASLDVKHLHLLLRCPEHNPRIVLGIAKQYATAQLKAHGLAVGLNLNVGQGLWAKRSHAQPITDQSHHENVMNYIKKHENYGAEVFIPPAEDDLSWVDLLV